jgi:hypothetical protein
MDHGPAGDGGDRQPNGGDENEALVRCRIGAGAESKKDQRRKNHHVRQRDDIKSLHIAPWRAAMPDQTIGGRQNSQDNHETGEKKAGNAKATVDVHPAGGNERGLRYE